jgi:hypothetical protein
MNHHFCHGPECRSPRSPRTASVLGGPIIRFRYTDHLPLCDLTPVSAGPLEPPKAVLSSPLPSERQTELLPKLPGISVVTVGQPVRYGIPKIEVRRQLSDHFSDCHRPLLEYSVPGFKECFPLAAIGIIGIVQIFLVSEKVSITGMG